MLCTFSWESSTTISRATAAEIQLLTRPFEVIFGSFSVISKPKLHSHLPEIFDLTSSTHRQDFQGISTCGIFNMTRHFPENFQPDVMHVFLGKFHYNFKSKKSGFFSFVSKITGKFGETATETLSEIRGTPPSLKKERKAAVLSQFEGERPSCRFSTFLRQPASSPAGSERPSACSTWKKIASLSGPYSRGLEGRCFKRAKGD